MNFKTFYIQNDIEYREVTIEDTAINKIYEICNVSNQEIVAVPDGCVDIQFVIKDGRVWCQLCGSFEKGHVSQIGNYDYCFGIKFNPWKMAPIFDIHKLVGQRYTIYVCGEDRKKTRWLNPYTSTFENKIDHICEYFKKDITRENDIVSYVIKQVKREDGGISISELIDEIGYSHCYAERVFKNSMGFSIKRYSNIIRLQKSIDFLNQQNMEAVYEKLGYYDQSHFIKEFKKFSSVTPRYYMKNMGSLKIV